MTTSEAIKRRSVRCRHTKRSEFEQIHTILMVELGWPEEVQRTAQHRSLWQIIKGWFA